VALAPIRLGIVGCGEIAPSHARAARLDPTIDLIGCFDIDQSRADSFGAIFGCTSYTELSSMLRDCEAVIVCTPPAAHAPVVEAACAAGCHVLCEKELAPDARTCRRMLDAAARARVVFAVGFRLRHEPLFRRVRDLIRADVLGQITYIHLWMPREWVLVDRLDATAYPGGVTLAHGCHGYDLLAYLMGPPDHIAGSAASVARKLDRRDDAGVLTFRWGDTLGSFGLFWVAAPTFLDRTIEVFGLRGHLTADYVGRRLVVRLTPLEPSIEHRREEQFPPLEVPGHTGVRADFLAQLENFAAACRGTADVVAPAKAGYDAVAAINRLRRIKNWLPVSRHAVASGRADQDGVPTGSTVVHLR
jgi:predicted dehydrogenase